MIKPIDLKDMPGFNPSVTNGVDSVSTGRVFLEQTHVGYSKPWAGHWTMQVWHTGPRCHFHGAMNKVSPDGIWRCLMNGCNCGCYWP